MMVAKTMAARRHAREATRGGTCGTSSRSGGADATVTGDGGTSRLSVLATEAATRTATS